MPKQMKFLATPEKGEVSALLERPSDANHLLVLGHGASTNMRHATLQTIADRMSDAGIATFRYNFPYMEHSESPLDGVRGLVFFAFPLHQPGKPDTKRAQHLSGVTVPMLFLSGTRDDLAHLTLLESTCKKLGKAATLHVLDTADHGFRTLKKRSRKSKEDVFVEMGRVVREWAARLK
jgi:hypothetical protein